MNVPGTAPTRRRIPYALLALGWEAVLLLGAVAVVVVAATQAPLFRGGAFTYNVAVLGLLAAAFALSLRTATPNLGVVAQAALAGAIYAKLLDDEWSAVAAGLVALGVLLVIGAFLGLAAGLISAPGWAVSLAGLAFAQAIALAITDGRSIPVPAGDLPSTGAGALWALLFLVVSIGGGLLWLIPAVRTLLSTNRDPRPGWRLDRLLGAVVGFTGSSVLAALAGVVGVSHIWVSTGVGDIGQLLLVVGVVLLGGVSILGRRGGVAGTALAVVLLAAVNFILVVEQAPRWIAYGIMPALAILAGLGIGRALEALAGPEPDPARPSDPTQPPPGYAPIPPQHATSQYAPPQSDDRLQF